MRDYRKLEVFTLADALTLRVYAITRNFPEDERYGLTSQLRRASVSIGCNIVEGASRTSIREFLRFLTVAYASACEVEYGLSLAGRLGYFLHGIDGDVTASATRTCRGLYSYIDAVRKNRARRLAL